MQILLGHRKRPPHVDKFQVMCTITTLKCVGFRAAVPATGVAGSKARSRTAEMATFAWKLHSREISYYSVSLKKDDSGNQSQWSLPDNSAALYRYTQGIPVSILRYQDTTAHPPYDDHFGGSSSHFQRVVVGVCTVVSNDKLEQMRGNVA